MKRKVLVFSGTRAEYGLLYWLLRDIESSEDLSLQLMVGAMHMSPEFGETWREIASDGFSIDARIEMLLSSDTAVGTAKSMGLGTISIADALDRLRPDIAVVLGDRFEALAFTQAAMILGIPIAHIHGGELTEGAYDDAIRHALTKMSQYHFVAAEPYRQRVIQMGEQPGTVFNVGALGLDYTSRMEIPARAEVLQDLDLQRPYILATYHPETLGNDSPEDEVKVVLNSLRKLDDHDLLITFPNADSGGRRIITELEKFAENHDGRVKLVRNLGSRRYLAALKYADVVVGNSSSALIEAPAFGVPTVNIGSRQDGRLRATSVIDCACTDKDIDDALHRALSQSFRDECAQVRNPYGSGNASGQVVDYLRKMPLDTRKHFYSLEDARNGR